MSEINVRAYLPEQPNHHLYDRPFTSLIPVGTRLAEKEIGDLADKWVRNILVSRKILPEARRKDLIVEIYQRSAFAPPGSILGA